MDGFGQVNLESTDLDWRRDMDAITKLLEMHQVVHFRYAALMSGHSFTIVPGTNGVAYGQGPPGIPANEIERFWLVVIDTRQATMHWIANDQLKADSWVQEKFGESFSKEPDSLALTYLLNSLIAMKLERAERANTQVTDYLETIKQQLLARGEKIGAAASLN